MKGKAVRAGLALFSICVFSLYLHLFVLLVFTLLPVSIGEIIPMIDDTHVHIDTVLASLMSYTHVSHLGHLQVSSF